MINGQLSVRPSKIVAGHEPEKTNEFLQAMGTAILNKVSLYLTYNETILFPPLNYSLNKLKYESLFSGTGK